MDCIVLFIRIPIHNDDDNSIWNKNSKHYAGNGTAMTQSSIDVRHCIIIGSKRSGLMTIIITIMALMVLIGTVTPNIVHSRATLFVRCIDSIKILVRCTLDCTMCNSRNEKLIGPIVNDVVY